VSQNRSHAVMAQRSEPRDSLEDFPTPCWATRALLEHVPVIDPGQFIWEPACNRGYMAAPLWEYGHDVWATDVHDYGQLSKPQDFLIPLHPEPVVDWVITNPPFRLAQQFIERALDVSLKGVAIFIRTTFLEGVGRYNNLFSKRPPTLVAQFSERVVLHKGKVTATGSTATAYCWVVWCHNETNPTELIWIPPCRKQLERASDYPTGDAR